jgi:ABC-type transporter Mla subunit MlaD
LKSTPAALDIARRALLFMLALCAAKRHGFCYAVATMAAHSNRNNVLAGLFVIASIVLGVWVAFMLTDRGPGAGGMPFFIRFSIDEGAAGLQRGSPVLLGGVQVGRVKGVAFETTPNGEATGIKVEVEVRPDVVLNEDAGVYLEKPLLGSLSSINIASVGSPLMSGFQGASARIEKGDVVMANLAPPGFLAQAGFGPEQVRQLQSTLKGLEKSVVNVEQLIDKGSPEITAAVSDMRATVTQARASFSEWDASVKRTLASAEGAAAEVEKASKQAEPLMTDARAAVASGRAMLDDARAIVSDNRGRIEEIIANVNDATGKINTETVMLLNDALRDARGAMSQAQQAIGDVQSLIAEQRPNIRAGMANFRLTAEQLKLTAVEVRSQPWRLLHQPTNKELSSQVIYDATRSYAEAASNVRSAAEVLSELSLRPGTMSDAELTKKLGEVGQELVNSMQDFRKAEDGLLQKLIEQK